MEFTAWSSNTPIPLLSKEESLRRRRRRGWSVQSPAKRLSMDVRAERAPFFPMLLKIEKLVYGGDGLARTDQGVIFVPRTAAGDLVEVEIVERKKDYSTARVTKL